MWNRVWNIKSSHLPAKSVKSVNPVNPVSQFSQSSQSSQSIQSIQSVNSVNPVSQFSQSNAGKQTSRYPGGRNGSPWLRSVPNSVRMNPTGTRGLFKHSWGTGGAPWAQNWPKLRNRHIKSSRKHIKSGRKRVHVKDEGKSSSEKLRRVTYYLFYRTDPPETSLKLTFYTKMLKSEILKIRKFRNSEKVQTFLGLSEQSLVTSDCGLCLVTTWN